MTIFFFVAVTKSLAVVSSAPSILDSNAPSILDSNAPSILETESVKVSRLHTCELLRDPRLKLKVDQARLPCSS